MTLTEPPNLALPVTTPNQIAVSNVKHVAPGNSKLFCYQKIVMKSERREILFGLGRLYDLPSAHQFEIDSPTRPHDL